MRIALSRSALPQAAFSLIEIILALGIISFSLVGILGLFPVAIEAANNSQRETQAALIARSIFDQLGATPSAKERKIMLADKYSDSSASLSVDLTQAKASIGPAAYDIQGTPLASSSDPGAAYIAKIAITPMPTPGYDLSQVVVTITPVNSKTVSYPFASILRQK